MNLSPATVDAIAALLPSFAGTLMAASVAYYFAARAWRKQERRKVYAAYLHALSRVVEAQDDWCRNWDAHPRA